MAKKKKVDEIIENEQVLELENGVKIQYSESDSKEDIEEKVRNAMLTTVIAGESKDNEEKINKATITPAVSFTPPGLTEDNHITYNGNNAAAVMRFCGANHMKIGKDELSIIMDKKSFVVTVGEILYKIFNPDGTTSITKVFVTNQQVVS